jgi:cell wall-associated NlpC family hydrolase
VSVTTTPTAAAMPAAPPTELVPLLQQLTQTISALVTALQGQTGSQPATGADALGGGPGVGQTPGQSPSSGCGCGGASGAVDGASDIGQSPPPKGAKGAPDAKGAKGGGKDSEFKGASGAPEADGAKGGGGGKGDQLVAEAKKYLGTKYVYGGAKPGGFDCSGLIQYVAQKLGINVPRVASDQAKAGKEVSKGDLQPGDLVYFKGTTGNPSEVSHIGMYVGDGKFIHAPKTGDVVKISNLNDSYYQEHWGGARRIT